VYAALNQNVSIQYGGINIRRATWVGIIKHVTKHFPTSNITYDLCESLC
jgi:hypothetical protein